MISLFISRDSGAIECINAAAVDFNGGVPATDGKMCVTSELGTCFVNGLMYTNDGRICVNIAPAARIAGSARAGIPVGPSGRVVCVVGEEVAGYVRAIPFSASGKVVLDNNPGLTVEDVEA